MSTIRHWNEEDAELDEALQDVRLDKQYFKFKERDRKINKRRESESDLYDF